MAFDTGTTVLKRRTETMASTYPSIEGIHPQNHAAKCELDLVRQLAQELPPEFAVFHSVTWSQIDRGQQRFGEIDVIVLSPAGDLAIFEVKSGSVEISAQGIEKSYRENSKDVLFQLQRQYGGLRQRLQEEGLQARIFQFLVLPDIQVSEGTVAYPREQIIDRHDLIFLSQKVLAVLPSTPECPAHFRAVRRFLSNEFALALDPSTRMGWLAQTVLQLSEGLATWVPRIHSPTGLMLVRATAGAGKTQLALQIFADSVERGQRCQYVCFNRPLADHLRAILPEQEDQIATFHELALATLRKERGLPPDFSDPQVFAMAENAFCKKEQTEPKWDTLIIDEAQDFAGSWVDALIRTRNPNFPVYILLDEGQTLYLRSQDAFLPESLSGAVQISCPDNFRSPRRIVEVINALQLSKSPVHPRSPIDGDLPGFHVWPADDTGGMQTLKGLVEQLIADGHQTEHIALLSFHGLRHSHLLAQKEIAGYRLRRFTGEFDSRGQACWSKGEILAESVFRFKGQSAPVVILCEIDFLQWDTAIKNRLYVGLTRAELRAELLLSPQADAAIRASVTDQSETG